jgi:EAL domain-containing protein (putative c-di-GMP-specific phosphodiesterase class I)
MHRAVRARAFSLHYQPQYDRGRGCIVGVEALLRWHHPDGRAVAPAEFVPLLEESGLIVELGEWVLRSACLQGQAWRDAGVAPLKIAVNLSALQFRGPQLVPMVQRVLAETGFDSAFLELEITESLAMHDQDGVIDKLTGLRALGVRLSIDDFGTGFSSLSYLQRFPVHAIKIDQSFIHQISDATPDSPMVAGIVALARHLGIHVIAEGVEQAVQERFLLGCGCNEMQGFRFSRPLPPHEISALLEAAGGAGNGLMEDRLEYFRSSFARPLAEVAGSPASG